MTENHITHSSSHSQRLRGLDEFDESHRLDTLSPRRWRILASPRNLFRMAGSRRFLLPVCLMLGFFTGILLDDRWRDTLRQWPGPWSIRSALGCSAGDG